jgi:hypothetical protein
MQADEKIQLIVVGESSVGKTSILFKYDIYFLIIIFILHKILQLY